MLKEKKNNKKEEFPTHSTRTELQLWQTQIKTLQEKLQTNIPCEHRYKC